MIGCEWGRTPCMDVVAGVAIPPVSSGRAPIGVCVVHAREAHESGWGIRRLRGGRLEYPDMICECVDPVSAPLDICAVCGLLICDEALVERLKVRHPQAAAIATRIVARQARQRAVFSASAPDDVRSGGSGAVEGPRPGSFDPGRLDAGCDGPPVALSTTHP